MRNVRPSWIRVFVDPSSNDPAPVSVGKGGTGPRGRAGTLSAMFLARVNGSAVPFLAVDAIASADGSAVVWRITDRRTGKVYFEETVPQ